MSQQWDLHYDVVIVGAGPAGLAAAIALKQRAPELGVCVLEKGAFIGAHQISGALVPQDLPATLFSHQAARSAPPAMTPVQAHHWWMLGRRLRARLPHWLLPQALQPTEPLAITSLGELCQWLGREAEALGVDLFTSQSVVAGCYVGEQLCGVKTADLGLQPDGSAGPRFEPGICIGARLVMVAEGAKGSLTRELTERYGLKPAGLDYYALGFKERWQIPSGRLAAGEVIHTLGWPLAGAGGGGFIYASSDQELELGWILPLESAHGFVSPFAAFEQFKQHPALNTLLDGGTRLSFGARVLDEGGWQRRGDLVLPGGLLLGCAAGLLDLRRQQGIAPAIHSGLVAAEEAVAALQAQDPLLTLSAYQYRLFTGEAGAALQKASPIKPLLSRFGGYLGSLLLGAYYWLAQWGVFLPTPGLPARSPLFEQWRRVEDAQQGESYDFLATQRQDAQHQLAARQEAALYLANMAVSGGPCHLRNGDPQGWQGKPDPLLATLLPVTCPAGVYRVDEQGSWQLDHENCLQCKACEARDPTGKLRWMPPGAGSGPRYQHM